MAGIFDNIDFGNAPSNASGLLGNVGDWLGNRSNMLIGLGAGIASGSDFGSAVANGLKGASAGRSQDVSQQVLTQQARALMQMGLPPQYAMMAITNPEFMKSVIPQLVPKYEHVYNDGVGGAFNPATGQRSGVYATPQFKTVGAGDTGGYVTPNIPGVQTPAGPVMMPSGAAPGAAAPGAAAPGAAAPGAAAPGAAAPGAGAPPTMSPGGTFTPVISSPEKPPPGFDYIDKNRPNLGFKAIPGGPATQLNKDTAGVLAMMQASKPELVAAEKFFGKSFTHGPINMASQAAGFGDIGRAQRGVRMAAEAALRLATGAAASDPETKRYADFYVPSVYDSIETRQQKLDALKRFMSAAENNMMAGRQTDLRAYLPPNTDTQTGGPRSQGGRSDPMRIRP